MAVLAGQRFEHGDLNSHFRRWSLHRLLQRGILFEIANKLIDDMAAPVEMRKFKLERVGLGGDLDHILCITVPVLP